ncbi:MAG: hypothetical protein JNM17_15000 [Archangium sp.]|nr:hypothetical protein [Archangium sp.]
MLERVPAGDQKNAKAVLTAGWRWLLRPHLDLFEIEDTLEPKVVTVTPILLVLHVLYAEARHPAKAFQDPPSATLLDEALASFVSLAADASVEQAAQAELRARADGLDGASLLRPSDFGIAGEDLDAKKEARKAKTEDVRPLRVGEVVEGEVVSVTADRAVIRVGPGDELAYLPVAEMQPGTSVAPKQTLTAVVFHAPSGGFALLSQRRLRS